MWCALNSQDILFSIYSKKFNDQRKFIGLKTFAYFVEVSQGVL